ncbi:glycosyltransferase, partial [Thermodesulfobacteriota bacterium]
METIREFFVGTYFLIFLVLAVFGLHRYFLVYIYYRNHRSTPLLREIDPLPRVTVQLPVYNEAYVVERLIEAVCGIEYPRDRLEIQVLDDSSDETGRIARSAVERFKTEGVDIKYIHRSNREGFKAGALENGLRTARGEFVAIFDADFIPRPGFLVETIHAFADKAVGMVQARWDHINRDHSLLTKIQALLLDGHFVMEHGARFFSGRFFNFNGTAGIWRRRCIEDAGGWQHDTLTEDLDLSYRAQLKGWRFVYLPDVTVPSEIPVEMNAFKSQQHRWTKGSIQTARKQLAGILSSRLPLKVKIESVFHLTNNFSYLCMALLAFIIYPSILARFSMGWSRHLIMLTDFFVFMAATASVSAFYLCSQREIGRSVGRTLLLLPILMSVGIGVSINNARAVLEA